MTRAYYNENDRKKAAALRELMADGFIMKGDVDERSIREVRPEELTGYTRCHFFAGIGLWDYALQLAGWPDDQPVWTGSCPCQPFSSAGRQKGKADDRHLWPEWLRLIRECRPATVFGEQVEKAIAHGWLDDVYQGLEAEGYAVGSAVLPACSVGAPHRRERLWFVSHTKMCRREQLEQLTRGKQEASGTEKGDSERVSGGVVGQPISAGSQRHAGHEQDRAESGRIDTQSDGSAWSDGVWIDCPDGKARLVERSFCLLVNGNSVNLASVYDACISTAQKEVITYGTDTKRHPNQILRMVREMYATEAFCQWKATRQSGFYEIEVLLDFLQRLKAACRKAENIGSVKKAHAYDESGNMRSLHVEGVFGDTPHRWQPYEQFKREFADPLQQLSFFLAQCASACKFAAEHAHATSIPLLAAGQIERVGVLHCAGDAIVPQLAAEFIKATKGKTYELFCLLFWRER